MLASLITNTYYKNNSIFINSGEPMLFEETYSESTTHLNLADADFIISTLGWSEEIWSFDSSKFNYPVLK